MSKLFREIDPGSTFYRKVGHHVVVMVKANDDVAVLVDDAPDSMRGLPTPYWQIPPMELMLGKDAYEAVKAKHPERIVTSANHPLISRKS
jgi:molybdopterin-binding protein